MNLASILKRLDRRFRDRDNSPHRSLGAQITKRRVAVSTYWRLNSEMLPPNATGTGPHPKYDVFISYRHVARDKKTARVFSTTCCQNRIDQEGSLVVYLNTDKTLWVMRRPPPFDGYAAQRFSAHPERYTARLTDHQEFPVQMLNEIQLAVDHAGRLEITNQISSSLSEQFKLKGIDFSDVENIRVTVTAEQHDIALELG